MAAVVRKGAQRHASRVGPVMADKLGLLRRPAARRGDSLGPFAQPPEDFFAVRGGRDRAPLPRAANGGFGFGRSRRHASRGPGIPQRNRHLREDDGRGRLGHAHGRCLRNKRRRGNRSRADQRRSPFADAVQDELRTGVDAGKTHLEALRLGAASRVVRHHVPFAPKNRCAGGKDDLEANQLSHVARRRVRQKDGRAAEEREIAFDELLFRGPGPCDSDRRRWARICRHERRFYRTSGFATKGGL